MALDLSGLNGDFFQGLGGGISTLFSASGSKKEASAYTKAAQFAARNAKLTGVSTDIQENQAERQIQKVLGGQKSDVAGAGLAQSGSAIDLLRDSTAQGELTKQLIRTQGLINQTGYQAEAAAYTGQAQAASAAAKGKTASGIGSLISTGLTVAKIFGFSDLRLKENIEHVGYLPELGLNLYQFNYIGQQERWEGVMAQEAKVNFPEAVHEFTPGGYLLVEYSKLGIKPRLVEVQ